MASPRGRAEYDGRMQAPQQCRYDAGCEVPPALTTLGNALKTTIPGGKYAALSIKGTVAGIEDAWTAMLRDWLLSSGLQLDSRVMFEYYPQDSSYDPATGVFDCKLCVPVAPL
jgi:AraC family transcriptional regulator